MVGRGCQGRPWLFGDLMAAFEGSEQRYKPNLRQVAEERVPARRTHGRNLRRRGQGAARNPQAHGLVLQGLRGGQRAAPPAGPGTSLEVLRETLDQLDLDSPYPGVDAEGPRGRAGSPKKPALPKDWLLNRTLDAEQTRDICLRRTGRLRWLRPGPPPPSWTATRPGTPPGGSRSRPRAPTARTSSGTAPGSCTPRRCAGSAPRPRWWPRTPTTSSGPGSPTASKWRRWAANWAGPWAATPTSWTPPASATTSATRPSATTANRP